MSVHGESLGTSDVLATLSDRVRANVPALLLGLPVWLLWKAGKVPCYADGTPRRGQLDSPEDRARLVTFEDVANVASYRHGCIGLGVALGEVPGEDIHLSGIDLDHVHDGGSTYDESTLEILGAASSYAERSPSGTGLHILGTGNVGTTKTQSGSRGLEIYSAARYFTVTGDAVNRARLGDLSDAARVARKLFNAVPSAVRPVELDTSVAKPVQAGGRNNFLTREAGKLRRIDLDGPALSAALHSLNRLRCNPPLDEAEVDRIAQGIARYPSHASEIRIVTLSSIETEPLRPLWPGKLWHGKTSLLAGDPGLGKSLSTLDIAARITRGACWPASNDCAPLGDVVLLSAEDNAADTLRPRLESAGADLARVHVITDVVEFDKGGGPKRRTFSLSTHLGHLERVFEERRPLLLVIDPITAYLSRDSDAHNTADVRAELAPLSDLAQRYGVAVLMVSHLNKATTMQAIYRITGSVAFVAAARSAFGVLRDPADRDRRLFLPVKNNLGRDVGGLAYRVVFDGHAPRIDWESVPVDVDIDEVTSGARTLAKQSAVDEVADWLRDQLRHGPISATKLWREAKTAGHSQKRVRLAIRETGAESGPMGYAGAWHYRLPESPQLPASKSQPTLADTDGHLPTLESQPQPPESASLGSSRQDSAEELG